MISVCIAIYNGERYIEEQLSSILNQLSSEDEIIISDDNSDDNSLSIIKSYQDPRIKIYPNTIKKGVIGNFENALRHANGEFIFLSDQDDIWIHDKVRKSVSMLQETDLVFSNAYILIEGHKLDKLLYNKFDNCGFFRNLVKNRYIGATLAFKSSLLKVALPFPEKLPMHDQWLGLIAECLGKTLFIEEPLIYYRRHSSNASSTGQRSKYGIISKIQFRVNILTALIKRLLFESKNTL